MTDPADIEIPKPQRRRWRKALLLSAAGLLLVALAALPLALRSAAVRAALLARAGAAIEAATGIRATAEDFRVEWRRTAIELSRVELRAAAEAGPPFLTAERARVEVRPRSLFTSHWRLRRLEVASPALDLGAPRPVAPAAAESAGPGRDISIERLDILGGSVTAPGDAFAEDSWLERLEVEGLDARGSLHSVGPPPGGRAEELVLEIPRAAVTVTRRGAAAVRLALTASLRGPLAGPLELEALSLSGPGLDLDASGRGGSGPDQPLELDFDLTAEPGLLVPDLAAGGLLESKGRFDWRRRSGRMTIRARDLPAEVVEPWLGREAMERLGAAATLLDVAADLDLEGGAVAGKGSLDWRRGEATLLAAEADFSRLRPEQEGGALSDLAGELRLKASDLRAELLIEPWLGREAPGRMNAAGTRVDLDATYTLDAAAPGGASGRARLAWRRGGAPLLTADLRSTGGALGAGGAPDLDTFVATLRVAGRDLPPELAQPWIGEAALERLRAAGTAIDLDADLELKDLRKPKVEGQASAVWKDAERALLTAEARSVGAASGLRLQVEGRLLPASPGRIQASGELRAPGWSTLDRGRFENGRVEIELPDVASALADLGGQWPELVPETANDRLLAGSLEAAADFAGRLGSPEVDGTATWRRADGAVLTLTAAGEPVAARGEARLLVEALELASLRELFEDDAPELAGRVGGTLAIAGSLAAWTAALSLGGEDLRWGPELPTVESAAIEVSGDVSKLELSRLEARAGERTLTASGHFDLEPPSESSAPWPRLGRAELRLEAGRPIDGVERVLAELGLAEGVAAIDATEIDVAGGRGELRATIPLGALDHLPELRNLLAGWTGRDAFLAAAEGPVALRFSLPALDAASLLADLGVEAPATFTFASSGALEVDLADLTAARGALELPSLTAAWEGHRLEAPEPLRLRLGDRHLTLERARLLLDGRDVELSGGADLAARWRPPEPPSALVSRVEARAEGTLQAQLLNPYLGGASATGPLELVLDLAGPLGNLRGRLSATGPEARLVAVAPYFTRVESPEIEIELDAGEILVRLARARLNQGTLELTGYREPGGALELFASLEGVRYRVDYGLSTVLSGDLYLDLPASGRGRLGGQIVVDQGLLRRDLNLEREILGSLMAPVGAAALDPDDPLARVDLDLDLATADGVRVKNNLADLRATWSPLRVRGTLAEPRVDGRLDVEAGGFVFLYGQTARVDQATVTLAGYPELPPALDLEMTTSLEDPMVAREGAGRAPVAVPPPREPAQIEEDRQALLAAGVATHYADQLAGRLGQGLGGTRISVEPLLVFGETDPGARLTVSRDLSTEIAVAVSIDLRTEGRQTYLLDFHELRPLPSLAAQVFTNDQRNQGATLQQTLDFGGGQADENRPRVREIRVETPAGFERKGLRAATGLRKGDRFPAGGDFDAEVDVAESLRQKGYPAAEVRARAEPVAGGRVDLEIDVTPGPRVAFEFRGDALPRYSRRAIRGLYRADFFEPAALEEMRRETVRALHGLGYRAAAAEVTVTEVSGPASGEADRSVVIEARGGERRPIAAVELRGVPAPVAERLAARFAAQVDRIELAAGVEDAERRLLSLLRGQGYPEPRLASRRLEGGGDRLVVEIEPGRRQRLAEIRFEGVPDDDVGRLPKVLPLAAGDPARSDLIAQGIVAIESELRRRGYVDARARSLAAPADPAASDELALTYSVEAGPQRQVAAVRLDGARATRQRWAERVAQIDKGEPVNLEEVSEARRRLFATGLFRSVVPDVERRPDGAADVVFDVVERPRYQLSYGLRFESSVGAGAVVDLVDRNAFGRGVTLGVRGLWSADDESARLYSAFPRVFGTILTLELFAEGRRFSQDADLGTLVSSRGEDLGRLVTSRSDGTAQVSVPLNRHTTTRAYYRYRDSHVFERDPDPESPYDVYIRSPVLGWQLVRDTRDDKIDAARGLLASIDLTGAGGFMASDFDFVRLFGKVSLFRPFGGRRGGRLTWAQSWRLGLAEAFGAQDLNREERFFAGGEYSVRGYRNDSLGPREVLGTTTLARGGEALLVVNQELRFPLWWGLRGLLFVDAGNVWEATSDFASEFAAAAGLGLRAPTPIGLVRLDVAFPFERRQGEDDFKIYLGLGNIF